MRLWTVFLLLLGMALAGCTPTQQAMMQPSSSDNAADKKTYDSIQQILDRGGATIDYDALWEVHARMHKAQSRIPRQDELLRDLIHKTNPNIRVDNMILIVAAMIMGDSHFAIDDIYALFESILIQDDRLNSWVLAFVSDAIGNYPYDIQGGDRLVDMLEEKVDRALTDSYPPKEYFGFHFLPPPKGTYIPDYLRSIEDQRIRVSERNSFYILIKNKVTEAQIETALKQLHTQGIDGKGQKIDRPLKYMIQHRNQFFETNGSAHTEPAVSQ